MRAVLSEHYFGEFGSVEPNLAAVCENWSDETVIDLELEKGTGAQKAHVKFNAPFQREEGTEGFFAAIVHGLGE